MPGEQARARLGGGHGTGDAVAAVLQRGDEMVDRRTGTDADRRPVLDVVECGEGCSFLLRVCVHVRAPEKTVPACAGTVSSLLNRRLVVLRSANHRFIEARSYFFLEAFFFAFFFAAMLDLHVGVNPRSSIYTVDGNASKG
jgi:hypothetical protein